MNWNLLSKKKEFLKVKLELLEKEKWKEGDKAT